MKIINIEQANYFIENGCLVTGCAFGNKSKVYLEFREDEILEKHMKIWQNNTRNKKGDLK